MKERERTECAKAKERKREENFKRTDNKNTVSKIMKESNRVKKYTMI
jgi:hypothetical protein